MSFSLFSSVLSDDSSFSTHLSHQPSQSSGLCHLCSGASEHFGAPDKGWSQHLAIQLQWCFQLNWVFPTLCECFHIHWVPGQCEVVWIAHTTVCLSRGCQMDWLCAKPAGSSRRHPRLSHRGLCGCAPKGGQRMKHLLMASPGKLYWCRGCVQFWLWPNLKGEEP